MQLSHLLTHSTLTCLEVSLMVSPGFFCLLVCSFLLSTAFCLYTVTDFFCIPVVCPKLRLYLFLLQSVRLFYNLPKCILLFFVHFIITGSGAQYYSLSYPTVICTFLWYTVSADEVMTTKSRQCNYVIRNGRNAIPKHTCPEAKGSNPTTGCNFL